MNPQFTALLMWCGNHKRGLIRLFYLAAVAFFLAVGLGMGIISGRHPLIPYVAAIGLKLGQLAVVAFFLTTYPGILGRFGFKHPLITLAMMFRRETGITSFFFSLSHALLIFVAPKLVGKTSLLEMSQFVLFGALAFFMLFLLYVTSNETAIRMMGRYWKWLHRLVYLIYWLIFLHVVLQKVSLLGVAIGFSAVLEISSLIFAAVKKRVSAGA